MTSCDDGGNLVARGKEDQGLARHSVCSLVLGCVYVLITSSGPWLAIVCRSSVS